MTLLITSLSSRFCKPFVLLTGMLSILYVFAVPQVLADAKPRELLFGVEPEHNIFDQVQKYRVLAEYLSDQLGVEVKLTIMSRYGEVVNRFKSLHLDGALLSSFTTTLAMRELYLTPVAYMVNKDGRTSSRGYVLVRKDSGIENVRDMRGKSVVFVDPATTEGYLFARAFFHQQGVDDPDSYFSNMDFAGSHASVIYAVLDGRADIGSAKDTVYNQLVSKDSSIESELMIFAQSPPVPELTLCVRSDLGVDLTSKLREALLNIDKSVEGYRVLKQLEAKRFAPASTEDFSLLMDMAHEAGLSVFSGEN